jgi:hypothetical protein
MSAADQCISHARVMAALTAINRQIEQRHLCSRCARIARGEPVCRICGEHITDTNIGWAHLNPRRRHPATPLIAVSRGD